MAALHPGPPRRQITNYGWSTRQHVVDMCDAGTVGYVWVGKHRRVPRAEVDRLLGSKLTREQERSLWLHRAVIGEIVADPESAFRGARENLKRWRKVHRSDGMTNHWFDQWEQMIDSGADAVLDILTSSTDLACELRQNSPFAGLLPEQRRLQVLAAFKKHWAGDHAS